MADHTEHRYLSSASIRTSSVSSARLGDGCIGPFTNPFRRQDNRNEDGGRRRCYLDTASPQLFSQQQEPLDPSSKQSNRTMPTHNNKTPYLSLVRAFILLVASHCPIATVSYPTGPGNCPAGVAATTGGHRLPTDGLLSFAEQGYELLIDDQVIVDASQYTLQAGTRYTIAVRATADPFRGALIRVDGLVGYLEPGLNADIADACTTSNGIGHFNKLDKRILSGYFEAIGGGHVTLDVTVVKVNNVVDDQSIYSFQQFRFPTDLPIMEDAKTVTTQDGDVTAPSPAKVASTSPQPTNSPESSAFWQTLMQLFGEGGGI